MPPPPAQKISFVITWTEEEEEGQRQEEELVVVLLVTKKREKKKRGNRKKRKEVWMAEHVRFHMTSVPVSGSTMWIFTVQLEGGRERERKREERDGKREPRRGLYAGAGLAGTSRPRLLSAPWPISARQCSEGRGPRGRGPDGWRGAGVKDTGAEGGQGWKWALETVLTVQRTSRTHRESRADEQVTFTYDARRREGALAGPSEARAAGLSPLAEPVGLGELVLNLRQRSAESLFCALLLSGEGFQGTTLPW